MSDSEEKKFSWYPGHMKKALDELEKKWIKYIDGAVELVDGRIPITGTCEIEIFKKRNKPVIKIFTHGDICDEEINKKLVPDFMSVDCRNGSKWKNQFKKILNDRFSSLKDSIKAQGRKRKLRICVFGLPNVGKSTFINTLIGGPKKCKTADQPGVTNVIRYLETNDFDLFDTPGLMPTSIIQERSVKLGLCNLLPAKLLDESKLSEYLENYLLEFYPKMTNEIKTLQTKDSTLLFKKFKQGLLGKICLDKDLLTNDADF
jgi:ribosome biogenesis GTPase A